MRGKHAANNCKMLNKMKKHKDFSKRLLVGITGREDRHWKGKLKEVEKYKLRKVALFMECFKKPQRKKIYKALLKSNIREIPLVHIRNDMGRDELVFLVKNFKSKYLTIHENSFRYMKKWKGFYKKLYLEMNYDNYVPDNVKVRRIGGFCIDLSHFKADEERLSKELGYITKRRKTARYFKCNHLNGYSFRKKTDVHTVRNLKEFDYLKTLPGFVFGGAIGIEVENSIKEQLKFKKYLVRMLNSLF